jgi:cellulose biosynthesis protein BcsQ
MNIQNIKITFSVHRALLGSLLNEAYALNESHGLEAAKQHFQKQDKQMAKSMGVLGGMSYALQQVAEGEDEFYSMMRECGMQPDEVNDNLKFVLIDNPPSADEKGFHSN